LYRPDTIVQTAGSLVRIPLRLPDNGAYRFETGVRGRPGAGRVVLRFDAPDGVKERVIVSVAEHPSTALFEQDLAELSGELVEVIFDATDLRPGATLTWEQPRVRGTRATATAREADGHGASPAPSNHPAKNAIVIVLDALRADSLGCYGYARDTTPCVDALAGQGTLFSRAYAAAPYTYSSTWSLFTSLYPLQHGSPLTPYRPGADAPSIPRTLHDAGLVTGFVSANPWFSDVKVGEDFTEFLSALERLYGVESPQRQPERVTAKAIDFIERHRSERFFLYMHYMLPHGPYWPRREDLQRFSMDPFPAMSADTGPMREVNLKERTIDREGIVQLKARYDETLRSVDTEVGRFMEALRTTDLAENTVIVVTADHGEGFYEHGWLLHSLTVYEEMCRIPLVIRGPGVREAFQPREDDIVSNVNTLPTVCSLLGIQPPQGIVGYSLMEAVPDLEATPVRAFAQGEFNRHPIEAYWFDRYKLVRNEHSAKVEAFDLARDPGETVNLAAIRPVLTDFLLANALAYRTRLAEHSIPPRTDVAIPEERWAELEALGYLH
jgi:arylsulfatase A-like enzyme